MELGRRVGGTAFAVQLRLEGGNLDGDRRYGIAGDFFSGRFFSDPPYTSGNSKRILRIESGQLSTDRSVRRRFRSRVSSGLFVFAHRLPRG